MKDTKVSMPPMMMEAIYRTSAVPEHQGNPLIEALPPFMQASDIADSFGRYPAMADSERLLSRSDRMMLISRLNNYLQPLPSHFEVIEKIQFILHSGYTYRNPIDKEFAKSRVKFYRESMSGKICPICHSGPSTAQFFSLFGTSGVGKTTVVDRALSLLPPVLWHREHNITQVVWLKIDCPLDGSLKQLLQAILAKLDTLLDSTYLKQVGTKRTVDELLLSVAKILASHNVGLLVIDEIQNLLDASGVGQAKMLNFFVTFANEVKIPVFAIGTIRALGMLEGTFREARRMGDFGTCIWGVLNDQEWEFFIASLWNYQWTSKYVPLTPELAQEFSEQTQRIPALVVRLFQLTQVEAIRLETEAITRDLIKKVANDNFRLVRPMLDALKNNDKKGLEKYQDLLEKGIQDITNKLEANTQMATLKAANHKRNEEHSERIRTISALLTLRYKEDEVQDVVTALFNAQPDLTCDKAMRVVMKSLNTACSDGNNDRSLVEIATCARNEMNTMEALSSAGLVSSTAKDL